ncbi:MAG: aminomethyl-transferring glycine dehydrogenase subunit GcvPB, partial [Thermoplasmata archaeon]|nr:aminomethyl-transferring glycine dehydrogenase subunit GcvPB [Thermoplasmata archaeon]
YRQARHDEPVIMGLGENFDGNLPSGLPEHLARKRKLEIPMLTESEVVRHYTVLSQMNFGVDSGFYPLGSCTMKYNLKIAEQIADSAKACLLHPHQPEKMSQGTLRIMHELQDILCEIGGMDAVTLQPAAGAHGEFTGMAIARVFHEKNGEERTEVVMPDSAHGTNPASAAMAGYDVITIPSKDGKVDIEALASALSEKTAAFMLTNPNTLGIFETEVMEIARMVHDAGALLYYDGANFNAIMGKTTPGKMGFDIVHFNLHKTFGTPHGGGGPGAGPVGVVEKLAGYLPVPIVGKNENGYYMDRSMPDTIGKVQGYQGNWGVLLKAYIYIRLHGGQGLKEVSERAVLNSNYLKKRVEKIMDVPYPGVKKHEFVASARCMKDKGVRAFNIGKRLLDYGFHAPTVYFPQLVEEALMIEPTEDVSKASMDAYADALADICAEDAEFLAKAPYNTSVRQVDETEAAKKLILSYRMMEE